MDTTHCCELSVSSAVEPSTSKDSKPRTCISEISWKTQVTFFTGMKSPIPNERKDLDVCKSFDTL